MIESLKKLLEILKEFVLKLLERLQNTKPVDKPPVVDEKPPVQPPADPKPPVEPIPEDKPTVIDNLLGGKPKIPVPTTPVESVEPPKYEYHDGFSLTGSGHVLRNSLYFGDYTFTFNLPEDKTQYSFNVFEVSGTPDSTKFRLYVYFGTELEVETQEFIRNGSVSKSDVKAGERQAHLIALTEGPLGATVYF